MKTIIIFLAATLYCSTVLAHKNSDAYVRLQINDRQITGQWDIALRDLNLSMPLDSNNDRNITWQEITENTAAINQHLATNLLISSDSQHCATRYNNPSIVHYSDGNYLHTTFVKSCTNKVEDIRLTYNFLFEIDAQHRALFIVNDKNSTQTRVLSADNRSTTITLSSTNYWQTIKEYIEQGVWHILIGYDHILFLLVLLIPYVASRHSSNVESSHRKTAIREIIKIITAFTVAHSITLALSVFNIVNFSGRWIETLIAASIILAAANNIYPIIKKNIWPIVFLFGLIHGFGFASVLTELGLPANQKGLALLSFNIGVELGQLTIVLLSLPCIFLLKSIMTRPRQFVTAGSVVSISLASIWLVERILTTKILSI